MEKFENYHVGQVGRQITGIVDFDETSVHNRTCVKPGVDPELDRLKRLYDGLDDLLNQVSKVIAARVPVGRLALTIDYYPSIGYLIRCENDSDVESSSALAGEDIVGWELSFTDG